MAECDERVIVSLCIRKVSSNYLHRNTQYVSDIRKCLGGLLKMLNVDGSYSLLVRQMFDDSSDITISHPLVGKGHAVYDFPNHFI